MLIHDWNPLNVLNRCLSFVQGRQRCLRSIASVSTCGIGCEVNSGAGVSVGLSVSGLQQSGHQLLWGLEHFLSMQGQTFWGSLQQNIQQTGDILWGRGGERHIEIYSDPDKKNLHRCFLPVGSPAVHQQAAYISPVHTRQQKYQWTASVLLSADENTSSVRDYAIRGFKL